MKLRRYTRAQREELVYRIVSGEQIKLIAKSMGISYSAAVTIRFRDWFQEILSEFLKKGSETFKEYKPEEQHNVKRNTKTWGRAQ